jgi:hypothetical protein
LDAKWVKGFKVPVVLRAGGVASAELGFLSFCLPHEERFSTPPDRPFSAKKKNARL